MKNYDKNAMKVWGWVLALNAAKTKKDRFKIYKKYFEHMFLRFFLVAFAVILGYVFIIALIAFSSKINWILAGILVVIAMILAYGKGYYMYFKYKRNGTLDYLLDEEEKYWKQQEEHIAQMFGMSENQDPHMEKVKPPTETIH
jgi:hypothetical protein